MHAEAVSRQECAAQSTMSSGEMASMADELVEQTDRMAGEVTDVAAANGE